MHGWMEAAFSAYSGVVDAVSMGQRRFLYYPDVSTPDRALAGVEDMSTVHLRTEDGLDLLSWYRPAANGQATMAYFHGNAGHIGHRGEKVRPYLDAGIGLLLVGYRGYGGNSGSPDEAGLHADGQAAYDFLAEKGVPSDRIVVYGESLGSGIAIQLASRRPVGGVVLESAFTSISDLAAYHYPFLPVRPLVIDLFDSLTAIATVAAPKLFLHGELDSMVPVDHARRLQSAAPKPTESSFIADGGHNDLYDFGAADTVIEFLGRRVSRGRRASAARA